MSPSTDGHHKQDGGHHGFSGLMDGLKDKLDHTKLHDAKINLHHTKSVFQRSIC